MLMIPDWPSAILMSSTSSLSSTDAARTDTNVTLPTLHFFATVAELQPHGQSENTSEDPIVPPLPGLRPYIVIASRYPQSHYTPQSKTHPFHRRFSTEEKAGSCGEGPAREQREYEKAAEVMPGVIGWLGWHGRAYEQERGRGSSRDD